MFYRDFVNAYGRSKKSAEKAKIAWKTLNAHNNQKLTFLDLRRSIRRDIRRMVYLKKAFDSFRDILVNLDLVLTMVVSVMLTFVFLLIFKFNFQGMCLL